MSDTNRPNIPWHSLSADEISERLNTSLDGLTDEEFRQRLNAHGPNLLRPPEKKGPIARFLAQFNNLLIYVLLAAGVVTTLLGEWVDSGVIFGVVIINAIIGFIQEGKAEKALDAIRNMLPQLAMVRRNGKLVSIAAEQVVPGDVVHLQSGDKVPADIRLVRSKNLRIDEAILTGESIASEKDLAPVAAEAGIGDRKCIAFSGTLVAYGQAQGFVIATGDETEIGRISGMLRDVETLTTPLLRQVARFAQWLTMAIVGLAAATFGYGILVMDYSPADMFLAAVGLAVAAIPEGLPAIMTITLAIGVQRMARRNAIIRRLPAVETLGSVTVVCTDKTGTLTRNEMTVTSIASSAGMFEVSGAGYEPRGAISQNGNGIVVDDNPPIEELARAAMLCNDATLEETQDQWRLNGDPTEGALLTFAMKTGLDHTFEQEEWPRTDVIPFESEHRFMATLHHDHAGHGFVYLKGAPEQVLDMCAYQRMRGEDVPLDKNYWETCQENMANRGQRLLAVAFKTADTNHRELRLHDVESGLTLLGILGIMDPPRDEAIGAVHAAHSAGIRVKMITGDHAVTAKAIGRQIGIGDGIHAVTGRDLDAYTEEEIAAIVQRTDVFARVSPEHKLQLVKILQAGGDVVAMTGDGVNDAPALKRADVGVAMGLKGTEAAKEAAEMVLADDNFASITHAIEEGRTVYDNLKKSILFILPTNGGEAFTIVCAILLGRSLPITPVQILWVNMITAVTLALALAFEPAEKNVMQRPPRDPQEPLLSRFLIWRILFVSAILVAGTFGLFVWERMHDTPLDTARTIAVNTLVMFEIFYLFSARYLTESSFNREGLLGNRYILMAIALLIFFQLLFTYLPPMQTLFKTTALDAQAWLRIVLVASSVFFIVEMEKAIIRRIARRH
jgi:magnesium-transporting ATPase (P-type)